MGLKSFSISTTLVFLGAGQTSALFHSDGKRPSIKQELIILVKGGARIVLKFFNKCRDRFRTTGLLGI